MLERSYPYTSYSIILQAILLTLLFDKSLAYELVKDVRETFIVYAMP
jgi:hypothetical protein